MKSKQEDKPIYDRLVEEQERVKREIERKKEELKDRELIGATFAPELPRNSISMAVRRSSGASVDGTPVDVYKRLSVSMTAGSISRANSIQAGDGDTMSIAQSSLAPSMRDLGGSPRRAAPVLPKEDLDKVFVRLSSCTPERQREISSPAVEPKRLVKPAADVEKIVDRLNKATIKSDLEALVAAEKAAQKEHIKHVPGSSIDRIFERVASHGTAAFQAQVKKEPDRQASPVPPVSPTGSAAQSANKAVKKRAPSPAVTPKNKTAASPLKARATPTSATRISPKPNGRPAGASTPAAAASTAPSTATPAAASAAPPSTAASTPAPAPASAPASASKLTPAAKKASRPTSATSTKPKATGTTPSSAASNQGVPEVILSPPPKALRGRKPDDGAAPATSTPVAPPNTAIKPAAIPTSTTKSKPAAAAPAGKDDFLAKLESSLSMLGLDKDFKPLAPSASADGAVNPPRPPAAQPTVLASIKDPVGSAAPDDEAPAACESEAETPVVSPAHPNNVVDSEPSMAEE